MLMTGARITGGPVPPLSAAPDPLDSEKNGIELGLVFTRVF